MKPGRHSPFDATFICFATALGIVLIEGAVVAVAGELAALVFGGHRLIPGGLGVGPSVAWRLPSCLDDPRQAWPAATRTDLPGPVALWTVLVAVQLGAIAVGLVAFRLVRHVGAAISPNGNTRAGRAVVERRMGRRTVIAHTATIHGAEAAKTREPVALGIDVDTGSRLFAKTEDYILAVGIPRVGKGEGFVIPAVLRHRGPAVVTATRHDTYMDTAGARSRQGRVFVFDPQGLVPDAETLRWNPVAGCEIPQKAILRARGFAGFAGVGPAVDGGGAYWEQVAASIIRSYLHAAALDGVGVDQLLDWSRRPGARQPIRILSRSAGAAPGWDEDLAASAEVEPRHRDSIWATVRRAFDCFADPRVLAATSTPDTAFNPAEFLAANQTVYLMGSPGAQHSVAPIVAALIEDIVDQARHQAAASASRRLESALLLMLDECANIAPLGDLPKLVAELGGLGVTTAVVLQSVASARNAWGEAGERALRDLANITLVWGGQKDIGFLEEISRLAGDRDEMAETITHNESGRCSSWSPRRVPILPIGEIANLPPGHAVLVSPHLLPRIVHLPPWRRDRALTKLLEPTTPQPSPASHG